MVGAEGAILKIKVPISLGMAFPRHFKCLDQGTFHQLWFKCKKDGYGTVTNFTHPCRSYLFAQHVFGNKIYKLFLKSGG